MIHKYKIKSDKQENGIYGMPINVKQYVAKYQQKDNELLRSAIIMAISEEEYRESWLDVTETENGLIIRALRYKISATKFYGIDYINYSLVDNVLTYRDGEDLQKYIRGKKLNRILK